MRTIHAASLGTLYTVFGGKLANAANVAQMQTLVWLAKNNRPPEKRKTGHVRHPEHPTKDDVLLTTPDDAYEYVAAIYGSPTVRPDLLEHLGMEEARIALVPVPASCTTKNSPDGERWPALALANALQSKGLGTVRRCIVNKTATQEQTASGTRTPAHEIADNLELAVQLAANEAILLVDDVITWGHRMAAMDQVLGATRPTAAICIAFTDDGTATDAYKPKLRTIKYTTNARPWPVEISKTTE